MMSLMQRALGEDWHKLPPALQAHYRFGTTTDTGHMDIEYPRFMQPYLSFLRVLGALINRSGRRVSTVVEKSVMGERQYWQRTITYPDGDVVHFDSFWVSAGGNQVIEFVNPVLGLQMAVRVEDGRLHYRGVRFVAKLGRLLLPIPGWLVLGRTTIVEEAVDETHFVMDFRLMHPLLGQVFRYSGKFAVRKLKRLTESQTDLTGATLRPLRRTASAAVTRLPASVRRASVAVRRPGTSPS